MILGGILCDLKSLCDSREKGKESILVLGVFSRFVEVAKFSLCWLGSFWGFLLYRRVQCLFEPKIDDTLSLSSRMESVMF